MLLRVRIGLIGGLLLAGAALAAEKPPAWGDVLDGVVQDAKQIKGFAGDYKWLSNFFPCRVEYEGLVYRSSEAAYQSAKFPPEERKVYTTLDADAAKKLAHSKKIDEAPWDARKDQVMRDILWAKFSQNAELRKQLVATGKKYLEETNWWDDEYWGVFHGKGENKLGKMLMEVRAKLSSE